MKKLALGLTVLTLITLYQTSPVLAVGSAGFENASLGSRAVSRANAVTAKSDDASAIASNPAGLSRLEKNEIYLGGSLILQEYSHEGAEGRSDETASETVIPTPFAYIAFPEALPNLSVGIGANSPFGLTTKYGSTGNFSRIAYFNELKTEAYHLSMSYALSDSLSIGGGWTYMNIDLKQVGKFNGTAFGTADAPFEYEVGGTGYGWNVGLLMDVTEKDTIGAFYRSEVRSRLEGKISTHDLTGALGSVGFGTTDSSHITTVDSDISLPSAIFLGWNHQYTDKFDFGVELGWTGWSSYDSLDNVFQDTTVVLAGFTKIDRDYQNTWSAAVGGTYQFNDNWSLSSGYYFQQRAANKNNYTNEIPDGHRNGASIGFGYSWDEWAIDFSYIAILLSEVDIENTAGLGNSTDVDGSYGGIVQIWSLGLRRSF